MTPGTPGDRRHVAESKEIAGPASRLSRARTSEGRAASGNRHTEWALASIIAGDGAAVVELPTPEGVTHNPTV